MSHSFRKLGMALGLAVLSMSSVAFAAGDAKIGRTFTAKCASCHGEDGKGETKKGKEMATRSMADAAWQKEFTDAQLKEAVEKGVDRTTKAGVKQKMDGYADKLKPEQVDGLVQYMRTFAPK